MNSRQNVKIKHYYKFPTVPKTDDSENSMTDVQCNHANYCVCILGNATSSLPDIEPPGHFATSIFFRGKVKGRVRGWVRSMG